MQRCDVKLVPTYLCMIDAGSRRGSLRGSKQQARGATASRRFRLATAAGRRYMRYMQYWLYRPWARLGASSTWGLGL